MNRTLVPARPEPADCTVCRTVGVLLGVLLVAGVVMNLPDIGRYLKLKAM